MPPITARFNWTAEDLNTGRKYAMRSKRWRLILLFSVAVVVSASGFFRKTHISHGSHLSAYAFTFGILIGAILIAVPLGKFIAAKILRHQFAKRPDANAEIQWEFTEQGISTASTNSQSEVKWPIFQTVIATPAGFLFMPNKQIFHFIPNRAFATPADIDNLKILAREHASDFKELK